MAYNQSLAFVLDPDTSYSTREFRRLMRSHMDFMRTTYANNLLTVSDHDAWKHRGRLDGLLRKNGFSDKMIWLITELNGYESPLAYDGKLKSFIVPPEQEMQLLEKRWRSVNSEAR